MLEPSVAPPTGGQTFGPKPVRSQSHCDGKRDWNRQPAGHLPLRLLQAEIGLFGFSTVKLLPSRDYCAEHRCIVK